ncbi:hypothetical protein ATO49_00155 [Mycolicibacterium fortuitum subsp. fortuitum DSM 46621 = ATCC 6841 = JCM 6387]|nr:hypothetical protein ATO49_00155 [Mycolicibacterium fortuitum subsp. fortuitum DSM 46621 = ATCC 6841 = JCM 6387]
MARLVLARLLVSSSGGRVIPYTGSMIASAWAAALATTARCSAERSTTNRQAWALAPEGAHVAARRQRVSVASSTGSSVNRRMVRAVDITSHTSSLADELAEDMVRTYAVAHDPVASARPTMWR